MRLRWLIPVVGVVAFAAVLAGPAPADPPSHVPGGPCIEGEQTVQLSSVPSYEEVTRALRSIEASSGGRVEVASAGMSGEGRELWYATVGDGPDVFWLQARIHGNELHSTEAVLQILRYLGSSGSPEAALIRDRLTVIAIPMYNPDGATANIRQSDPVPDRPQPGLGAVPPAGIPRLVRALGGDPPPTRARPAPHGAEPDRGGDE